MKSSINVNGLSLGQGDGAAISDEALLKIIAEKDLELRGPGELLGIRQTGQVQFRIADLARDSELLDHVKATAEALLNDNPDAVEALLKRWLADGARFAEV